MLGSKWSLGAKCSRAAARLIKLGCYQGIALREHICIAWSKGKVKEPLRGSIYYEAQYLTQQDLLD